MVDKIELRSTPHRQVPVRDILANPHRDLKLNPVIEERVEDLLDSFERNGFWDNIVVRKHPTQEDKFELAYGHNRWAALKDKRVSVDTITIPVAKLSDYDMYCAMVDENAIHGGLTPKVAMENIHQGCKLIEAAFDSIGPESSWEQFNKAIGRDVAGATARSSNRDDYNHGFEQARNDYFGGLGLGRVFVAAYLPGTAAIREHTITEVLNARYAELRAATLEKQAEIEEQEAEEEEKAADKEPDPVKKTKKKARARKKKAVAKKKKTQATKAREGNVKKDILLMFETNKAMTNFASIVRRLGISPKYHQEAAQHVIDEEVSGKKAEKTLQIWWFDKSGEATRMRARAKLEADREKVKKLLKGVDFNTYVLTICDALKDLEESIDKVIPWVRLADANTNVMINKKMVPVVEKLNTLIERWQASLGEMIDVTPAPSKMLEHQKGN